MTKEERLKTQLAQLHEDKKVAMRKNDLYWLEKTQRKIDDVEQQLAELRNHGQIMLSQALKDKGEDAKNRIYKNLLRISVLADVVNNACEECKSELKKMGLQDFMFRKDVDELCKISQRIASVVLLPNNKRLEDFIVDNDDVVDECTAIADKHLNDKLGL